MKIAFGADHGGYRLKNQLIKFLEAKGHEVADLGTHTHERCDYPPIGYKLAASVSCGLFTRGILICKSGIGFSIVANKLHKIRAALCLSKKQAVLSRQHNNANVLVLAANFLNLKQASSIVDLWLNTEFSGGRHGRRVKQIANIERKILRNNKSEIQNPK